MAVVSRLAPSAPALAAAILIAVVPGRADGQQPTVKPQPGARANVRLPAPRNVRVVQTGAGELTVTWEPVPGARSYNLGRAVGTNGFQRVADGIGLRQARYVDRSAPAGVRVVYAITPIDSADVSGLRATAEPFTAWQATGGGGSGTDTAGTSGTPTTGGAATSSPTPPLDAPRVAARVEASTIHAGWAHVRDADQYLVRVVGPARSERTIAATGAPIQVSFPGLTPGEYVVEAMAIDAPGTFMSQERRSTMSRSAPLTVAPAASDTAVTEAPPATVTVASQAVTANAAALALRLSGRVRVAADGVDRWISLTPAIVSVAADGTITALAAGTGRVLGYGASAAGTRVTAVEVVVAP